MQDRINERLLSMIRQHRARNVELYGTPLPAYVSSDEPPTDFKPPVERVSIFIPVTDEQLRDAGLLYGPWLDETYPPPKAHRTPWLRIMLWRIQGAWSVLRGTAWTDEDEDEDD
jgi:hypothetical protein